MEKTPYQRWLDGRLIDYPVLGELAWKAALAEAKQEILSKHYIKNPVVANIMGILDGLAK